MIVIREVRQASRHSAANLGLQQHHQSTSSNSDVPTIMLITTSLVHTLLCGTWGIVSLVATTDVILGIEDILRAPWGLVYVYNFCMYLMTCKQFHLNSSVTVLQ